MVAWCNWLFWSFCCCTTKFCHVMRRKFFSRFYPMLFHQQIFVKWSVQFFHLLIICNQSAKKYQKFIYEKNSKTQHFTLHRNTHKKMLHWRLFASGDPVTIFALFFFPFCFSALPGMTTRNSKVRALGLSHNAKISRIDIEGKYQTPWGSSGFCRPHTQE